MLSGVVDMIAARRARLVAVAHLGRPAEVLPAALAARGLRVHTVRCLPHPISPPLPAPGRVRADVLVVHDAQWLDRRAIAALETLVRDPHTDGVYVCLADRPVAPAARAALRRLWHDGLAQVVAPRPLSTTGIAAVAATALRARPDPALVRQLRQVTGGCRQALPVALAEYLRTEAIRVVGRHAYLLPLAGPPTLPDHHALITAARPSAAVWSVAKAAAVLSPLGPAMPALVAAALDIAESEVLGTLGVLRDAGVLRRSAGRWRFRVPMVAATIRARLGPYEASRFAQVAVTALWDGTASCDDPGYRTDQVANAGTLVDRARACAELLAHAETAAAEPRSCRWLLAAANLVTDDTRRAEILARHAVRCCHHGAYAHAVSTAERVLREHRTHLPADVLDEVTHALVLAGHALGAEPVAGTDEIIATAASMLALGRARDARDLLDPTTARRRPGSPYLGRLLLGTAQLATGSSEPAARSLAEATRDLAPADVDRRMAVLHPRLLPMLLAGDVDDAEKLLIAEGVPAERLAPPLRAVLALRQGRLREGDDLVRRSVAVGARRYDPAYTMAHQWTAALMMARGELVCGRELLADARAAGSAWPHLLDAEEASIDRTLGNYRRARQQLRRGLVDAAERGIVLETDRLWAELAETELWLSDPAEARRCHTEAVRIATERGSAGAMLRCLVARAIVDNDARVAGDVLRLAGERAQPFELACVIGKLATYGLGEPALLSRAYDLLGDLDALLYRAWLRNLMRDKDIQVPGRARTVAENERLLAVLVADGLSNKQLATVLQTSEKSIEGRLSRLFARSGYQSRVALTTAVHAGRHPPP